MSVEMLLAIAVPFTVILGPLFASLFTISSRLAKIEQRLESDNRRVDEILVKHDRHIHEVRNSLHQISLQLAIMERKSKETSDD
jgi:hypothetical protein